MQALNKFYQGTRTNHFFVITFKDQHMKLPHEGLEPSIESQQRCNLLYSTITIQDNCFIFLSSQIAAFSPLRTSVSHYFRVYNNEKKYVLGDTYIQ